MLFPPPLNVTFPEHKTSSDTDVDTYFSNKSFNDKIFTTVIYGLTLGVSYTTIHLHPSPMIESKTGDDRNYSCKFL